MASSAVLDLADCVRPCADPVFDLADYVQPYDSLPASWGLSGPVTVRESLSVHDKVCERCSSAQVGACEDETALALLDDAEAAGWTATLHETAGWA